MGDDDGRRGGGSDRGNTVCTCAKDIFCWGLVLLLSRWNKRRLVREGLTVPSPFMKLSKVKPSFRAEARYPSSYTKPGLCK